MAASLARIQNVGFNEKTDCFGLLQVRSHAHSLECRKAKAWQETSVADPGCLSRIRIFPNSGSRRSRIWILKKEVQDARGVGPRFLILSAASAVCPIMTKFPQYTPLHLLLSAGVHLPARLKGRGGIVKIIRAGRGKTENKNLKSKGYEKVQRISLY